MTVPMVVAMATITARAWTQTGTSLVMGVRLHADNGPLVTVSDG